jgi:hypothetical protein
MTISTLEFDKLKIIHDQTTLKMFHELAYSDKLNDADAKRSRRSRSRTKVKAGLRVG